MKSQMVRLHREVAVCAEVHTGYNCLLTRKVTISWSPLVAEVRVSRLLPSCAEKKGEFRSLAQSAGATGTGVCEVCLLGSRRI